MIEQGDAMLNFWTGVIFVVAGLCVYLVHRTLNGQIDQNLAGEEEEE